MQPKAHNISVLGYALLGLLRSEPGSGYEVRSVFDAAMLGRFSSSPGSIYPALRRLEGMGLIVHRGTPRRGRFAITDKGRAALLDWLSMPVTSEDVERRTDVLMLKFAFMEGMMDRSARQAFLSAFEAALEEHLGSLSAMRGDAGNHMPLHGRLALDHQIAVAEANLGWTRYASGELAGT